MIFDLEFDCEGEILAYQVVGRKIYAKVERPDERHLIVGCDCSGHL